MAKQKYWVMAVSFFIVVGAGISLFVYYGFSPQNQVFISAHELSPYVSREQTRVAICSKAAGAIFKNVCQKEFDKVAKSDDERIDQLFLVLDQAKNDSQLSDYDKFLLSQLVFATLPAKDSPAAFNSNAPSRFNNFNNIFGEAVKAQATGISRAQYEKHLIDSLASIKQNCPAEGDDAWILTAMCSEYTWINGVRQPIYSQDYGEAGGACVFTPAGEAEAAKLAHYRSDIEIKMRREYDFFDSAKNTSSQIACAFSCISHKCPEPDKEKNKPVDVYIKVYTEPGYVGPNLLQKLLNATYKPVKKIIDTPPAPVPTTPLLPPVEPRKAEIKSPPPKPAETKPAELICCYDAKARQGVKYYLPFSGACAEGDSQVPFDDKCANPLTE